MSSGKWRPFCPGGILLNGTLNSVAAEGGLITFDTLFRVIQNLIDIFQARAGIERSNGALSTVDLHSQKVG